MTLLGGMLRCHKLPWKAKVSLSAETMGALAGMQRAFWHGVTGWGQRSSKALLIQRLHLEYSKPEEPQMALESTCGARSLCSHTPSQALWSMVSSPGTFPPWRSLSWVWACMCVSSASVQTLKVKCAHTKAQERQNCSPLTSRGRLLISVDVANLCPALIWEKILFCRR